MADFFGKLKVGFNKGTKVIQAKGTSAIEANKVKSELNALKKKRVQLFADIGKTVYEADKDGNFTTELVKEVLVSIKECDEQIVVVEAKINEIKESTEARLKEIDEEAKQEEAEMDANAEIKVEASVPDSEDVVDVEIEVEKEVVTQEIQSEVEVEIQEQHDKEQ